MKSKNVKKFQKTSNQLVNDSVDSKNGLIIYSDTTDVTCKKLMNLQHEVCVTLAKLGKGKNCKIDFKLILLRENLVMETEESRQLLKPNVKIEAAHLSGAKAFVNYRRVSPENVENFLSS